MENRTLQLCCVGGDFATRLGKAVRAFAEARDLRVCQVASDASQAQAAVSLATLIVMDDAADLAALDFVPHASYAMFGVKQSERLSRLHAQALAAQAQVLTSPRNSDGSPDAFELWMAEIWQELAARGVEFRLPQLYAVEVQTNTDPVDVSVPKGFRRTLVSANDRLTSEDYERPSHMLTLDIAGSGFAYNLGDHVTIMPRNSPEAVAEAAQVMGLDLEQVVVLHTDTVGVQSTLPLDTPVRVRDLLSFYLDIQGLASRKFLAALSLLATDPAERQALHELATRMSADSPYRRKLWSVFSPVDAVRQHPSVRLTLAHALALLPPLRPRCYSASSSPLKNPDQVQCTFVVLQYPTQDKTLFRGLSTNFLRGLKPGDAVSMTLRPGFKRVEVDTPGIQYVGCALGSGIALLRGIVQHFYCTHTQKPECVPGQMLLYYGVRHQAKDFIFKDELLQYQEAGVLKMHESFSNDQQEFITPATKIGESREELMTFLVDDPRCKFIYCGPAGPAYESVERAIKEAIAANRPAVDADAHLATMRAEARWEVQAFSPAQDPENPFRL